jgi:hypothetical protein
VDCCLSYFRQWLITHPLSALCLSSLCLLKVQVEISSLPLPASPVHLQHPAPSAACSFSAPCLLFRLFFPVGLVVSLSRGLCWFIPGVGVGVLCDACCSPVGLPNVSQAGLELASGDVGALLFSQCSMAWRSFVWAGGSGCQSFDSSWCFFSAKCGSSISAKFLIYRVHAICFCTLVAILDPSH